MAEINKGRFSLVGAPGGPLKIWRHPQPTERYVLGADASSGGYAADRASCCVIETRSCALVAKLYCKRDPIPFGRMCAMLAWHYNTGLLAFETHPSQHGVSACIAARDMEYPNLYRRTQQSTVHLRITEELGWATTMKTKPLMIDAVRAAIADRVEIPDKGLVMEIAAARYKENDELFFEGVNDDSFTAYSIALLARRHAVQRGFVSPEDVKPLDATALWWKHREAELAAGDGGEYEIEPDGA